jgi:cytochrome c-type biogenesis protein CcmF
MPWLAGTALLHSAVVMEKREALKIWTILLAILAFSLSLMGTFLVRSGVLSSVHAFAVDPKRGIFVLAIMALFIGGSLTLFAMRASGLRQGGLFAPISREAGLVLNNVLLMTATATVLVGTLYPLALEAVGGPRISVGPPYFNLTFVPLMALLLAALPLGPMLAWKRADIVAALQRLLAAAFAAAILGAIVGATHARGPWLAPFAMALGGWVLAGAVAEIAHRIKLGSATWAESRRRLVNLPRSALGTALAHGGVGVTVIGIVAASAWQIERAATMRPGDTVSVAGYDITFRGLTQSRGPNFDEQSGQFVLSRAGAQVALVAPSRRLFDAPRQLTTEAGIYPTLAGDVYVILGEEATDGAFAIRIYFNPLVRLIWIGAVLMFLGGLLSLSDRRLRVGAPRPARAVGLRSPAPAE